MFDEFGGGSDNVTTHNENNRLAIPNICIISVEWPINIREESNK